MKKHKLLYRIAEIIVVVVFSAALILGGIQFTIQWYHDDISEVLKDTMVTMQEANETSENEYQNYQELCQKIAILSGEYLLYEQENTGTYDLNKFREMLDVNGAYVVRSDGTVVQGTDEDTDWRKNPEFIAYLEKIVDFGVDKPFMLARNNTGDTGSVISNDDETVDESYLEYVRENTDEFLIGSTIIYNSEAGGWEFLVLRDDNSDLVRLSSGMGNTETILSRMIYGTGNQYIYARPRGHILYTSFARNENEINVRNFGLPEKITQDDYSGIFKVNGKYYYCLSKRYSSLGENAAVIFFLPMVDIFHALLIVLAGEFTAMLFSFMLIRICFRLIQGDTPAKVENMNAATRKARRTRFAAVLILCCLGTGIVSIFGNVLYIYADVARQCMARSRSLADSINNMEHKQDFSTAIYDHYMDRVTRILAGMLSETPVLREGVFLRSFGRTIQARHLLIYDKNETVVSSSGNYNGIKLSDDPDSLSNEFRWLLHGKPVLVQKVPDPDFLDQPYYYSGAPLMTVSAPDEEGEGGGELEPNGFLQIVMPVSFHDDMVRISSLKSILTTNYTTDTQTVFAVDTEKKVITSPNKAYDGFEATSAGFVDGVLTDGFIGFIDLQRRSNIVCTTVCDKYYAIVATDTTAIPLRGLRNGMVLALYGIAAELLFFILHMWYYLYGLKCQKEQGDLPFEAESEEQVEQEQFSFFRKYLFAVSLVVTLIRLFSVFWLNEHSAAYFIFVTQWAKGPHIFAVTTCLIDICIAVFLLNTVNTIVLMLCNVFTPKQETIMRMALSFAKYIVVLGTVIVCADTLGAPTSSLLALSGVVTLMFSVGAQSLMADIIAGLFIIFEGTYKVGDMITVDDWHGKVIEIGIRNTKIRDLIESNVKIINNSTIRNIINYSEYPSWCCIKVGVDYTQNIKEIEEIFEREKDMIRKKLPPLEGDITLLGLDQFQDSCVVLAFQVLCRNEIYPMVRRALNREIKEMFDRHGINIPFPQVVLSDREDEFLEKIKRFSGPKAPDPQPVQPQNSGEKAK